MKRILIIVIAIIGIAFVSAQSNIVGPKPFGILRGIPTSKLDKKTLVGALVTVTDEWNKKLKFQQKVSEGGFEMRIPYGGYILTIEMEGYDGYKLEIDIDSEETDLGFMRILTKEQAEAKIQKRIEKIKNR
ncbi:MAG: hypothetical protein KBS95_06340 [Alistipes sp.]|nr:hypothetical protein [Candidatus Alistipes equi]